MHPAAAVHRIRDRRDAGPGPERDSWLTFAVAGGGPTGVEIAGQIREVATRTLANEFHSIKARGRPGVLLFDRGERVLETLRTQAT